MVETLEATGASTGDRREGPAAGGSASAVSWRADVAVVALLSTLFVVLFVLLRQPPLPYDPIEYFRTAQNFESVAPFHRSLRIGMLGPVRAMQALFGYSQAAYYAVPLASGVLLLASTYVLGRVLSSRTVGAAAAVLVTFTTPVFATVHQLWPDLPGAAVFTAGLAATTVLSRRYGRDGIAPDVWAHVGFAVAGLVIGWSYLIREFTVVLFPVVVLPFWQFRTPWRLVLPGAAGALSVFAGELAFNARFHDDAFVRIRDLLGAQGEPPAAHVVDLYEARAAERGGFLERLGVFPVHLTAGRVPLLAGVGALALLGPVLARGRTQRRGMVVLLAWIALYWVVVLYLSLDVDEYGRALYAEKIRYWYPVLPAVAVAGCAAGAAFLSRVPQTAVRRGLGILLVLLVVLGVGADIAPRIRALGAGEPHSYEQLRRWLATDGGAYDRFATSQRTRWVAELYTTDPFGAPVWEGTTTTVNTARRFVGQQRIQDADLLVVDDTFFEARRSNWREVTPPWLLDLPDEWRPVAAVDDGEVVVYERTDTPVEFVALPVGWGDRDDDLVTADDGAVRLERAAGGRGSLSVVADPAAGTGAVVLTEFDITTAGNGNVVPFCFMTDADGRAVRRDASSYWGVGFVGPQRTQAACTVPVALAPPVSVRLGLAVNGPMVLEVGSPSAATVTTSVDWRDPG